MIIPVLEHGVNSSIGNLFPSRDRIRYNKIVLNTNHLVEQDAHYIRVNIGRDIVCKGDVDVSSMIVSFKLGEYGQNFFAVITYHYLFLCLSMLVFGC